MAVTEDDCARMLDEIGALWAATSAGWRDGLLAVGAKVREYLAARLAAGDGLGEAARRAAGATREAATTAAAVRLRVSVQRVNELVRTAAVDALLRPDGGWGSLSYATVRSLRVLIARPAKGAGLARAAGGPGAAPSDLEVWEVRPEFRESARALAAAAVAGGWTEARAARELTALGRPPRLRAARSLAPPRTIPDGPMTSGDVARFLSVAPRTVNQMIDRGILEGRRVPGSLHRRVDPPALAELCRREGIPAVVSERPTYALWLGAEAPVGAEAFDCPFRFAAACVASWPGAVYVGDDEGLASARRAAGFLFERGGCDVILAVSADVDPRAVDCPGVEVRVRPLVRGAVA